MRSRPDQPGYSPVSLFLSFAPADGPLIQPTVQQHVESARIVRQDESMFMRKRQTDCDWRMIKLAPNSAKGAIAKVIDQMLFLSAPQNSRIPVMMPGKKMPCATPNARLQACCCCLLARCQRGQKPCRGPDWSATTAGQA